MSSLTIRPAPGSLGNTPDRIDLFGVVPNRLGSLSLGEIQQLPIRVCEQFAKLGDFFQVADGDRGTLVLEGDFSKCDSVGGDMENGQILLTGDVGDFLAERMRGGSIEVRGSAARFAGSGLQGGVVEVLGNCGECAAAAAPGAKRGMNGGLLVIHGNCEAWLATRMRRGTVIVHGRVAAGCASRMIAGTLVLCGEVELPIAANMARGTILMLDQQAACTAPAGFTAPEHTELSYLRILLNDVAPHLPKGLKIEPIPSNVFRSLGDRVNQGLGEIIWLNAKVESVVSRVAHA
jgi:formylmethanofuran dehydrogenase subunit C